MSARGGDVVARPAGRRRWATWWTRSMAWIGEHPRSWTVIVWVMGAAFSVAVVGMLR